MNIDLKNHIAMVGAETLNTISAAIREHYAINYFGYVRNYPDGRHIFISSRPEATQFLFEKDFHKTALCFKHPEKYEFDSILWDGCDQRYSGYILGEKIRELFDISHGFSLVERHPEYTELFEFAGSHSNPALNNTYYAHFNALKHFILYFREHAQLLLCDAEKQAFKSPYSNSLIDVPDDILMHHTRDKMKAFVGDVKLKKVYLSGKFSKIAISNRELECIRPLLAGCSYKQIARILNISPRTVESRIEQLREKLGCEKKKDLMATLSHVDIKQVLDNLLFN